MNTKQEKLYFQYEIHVLSPTNFFKFTVFFIKKQKGLKLWFKDNINSYSVPTEMTTNLTTKIAENTQYKCEDVNPMHIIKKKNLLPI